MDTLRNVVHLVADEEPRLVRRFYDTLFVQHPELRHLFPADMGRLEQKVGEMLLAVIDHLDDPEWLRLHLPPLGTKHHKYGVRPEMYGWVAQALSETVATVLGEISEASKGPVLGGVTEQAVLAELNEALGAAATLMLSGYPAEQTHPAGQQTASPPFWLFAAAAFVVALLVAELVDRRRGRRLLRQ